MPIRLTMNTLLKKKVAILAADGFEQSELEGPLEALKGRGRCRKLSL